MFGRGISLNHNNRRMVTKEDNSSVERLWLGIMF